MSNPEDHDPNNFTDPNGKHADILAIELPGGSKVVPLIPSDLPELMQKPDDLARFRNAVDAIERLMNLDPDTATDIQLLDIASKIHRVVERLTILNSPSIINPTFEENFIRQVNAVFTPSRLDQLKNNYPLKDIADFLRTEKEALKTILKGKELTIPKDMKKIALMSGAHVMENSEAQVFIMKSLLRYSYPLNQLYHQIARVTSQNAPLISREFTNLDALAVLSALLKLDSADDGVMLLIGNKFAWAASTFDDLKMPPFKPSTES